MVGQKCKKKCKFGVNGGTSVKRKPLFFRCFLMADNVTCVVVAFEKE
jgi:hypothetical protein